jgi:hypothetical protein
MTGISVAAKEPLQEACSTGAALSPHNSDRPLGGRDVQRMRQASHTAHTSTQSIGALTSASCGTSVNAMWLASGIIEADNLGAPFKLGCLMMVQVLEPDAPVSIGTLYIHDDGSDVAVVRMQDELADLWIVDRFSGDGGSRRCALARCRWHPRAAIRVQ